MLMSESIPSNHVTELAETLPVVVEADFAPIPEMDADEFVSDSHHDESLRTQEAFELAAQAALQGNEVLAGC